jgi:hypothetical protein
MMKRVGTWGTTKKERTEEGKRKMKRWQEK